MPADDRVCPKSCSLRVFRKLDLLIAGALAHLSVMADVDDARLV